jgi:DNA-binding NtrC family response regulator
VLFFEVCIQSSFVSLKKGAHMKKAILLVSNNTTILRDNAITLAEQDSYDVIVASTAEDAIEKFQQTNVDIAVLYNDMDAVDKNKLSRIFQFQNTDIHVLYISEDMVLAKVLNELVLEIDNARKPSYTIQDDALLHAAYNIKVEQPD